MVNWLHLEDLYCIIICFSYKKTGKALVLPVLNNALSRYPRSPYMVRRNSTLAKDPVPPINFKGLYLYY